MTSFAAIVLAGQRDAIEPLAEHAGATCKALVAVNGEPLLLRVIRALQNSDTIAAIHIGGPSADCRDASAALTALLDKQAGIQWHPPQDSPSLSALTLMQSLPGDQPVLLTTSDLAFPRPERFAAFCRHSRASGADVCIGLAPYATVKKGFPELDKTVLRFRDGAFCGCNLFAFLSENGRQAAEKWRAVEAARKSPLKVIRILGLWSVIEYRLGRLTLDTALARLSKRFGLRIQAVILDEDEAAIDIDSIQDYETLRPRFTGPLKAD